MRVLKLLGEFQFAIRSHFVLAYGHIKGGGFMKLKMLGKLDQLKYFAVALLAVLFLVLFSLNAFSAVPMGNEDTFKLSTSRAIYKQEYQYEEYDAICSRQVPDGTREVCSSGRSERRCRKVSGVGEECWDEPGPEICHEETAYTTETYDCVQTRRVSVDVYDYTIRAEVNVVKSLRSKNFDLNACSFDASLSASGESFHAYCNEAIVKATLVSKKEVPSSEGKQRFYNVELDFFPIVDLDALKFGLSDLKYTDGKLTFKSYDLSRAYNFNLKATLTRNRFLLKDKVVLNKTLTSADFKVLSSNEKNESVIELDLQKLSGGFDASKKHTFKLNLNTIKAVDIKGAINSPGLSNELSQSLVINE